MFTVESAESSAFGKLTVIQALRSQIEKKGDSSYLSIINLYAHEK